jgi:hypothetical protein
LSNNPDYDFVGNTAEIIKNGTPDFLDIYTNRLQIGVDSDGNGFGNDVGVMTDLINTARNLPNIDLGAYQHINFPTN